MLFSSIPFLYYFLPIVLLIYFITPGKLKNSVLLISSLVFYGWGEPRYVFLMMATILIGYVFGLLVERFRKKASAKVLTALSAVLFLGVLGYFKYANFFIENINRLTGFSMPFLNVVMPIGISFYTFQLLSYIIDVYRGDVKAQKNPINLGAYIALFPQLIAGPIVRYRDIEIALRERVHTIDKTAEGIRRLIIGLSKKVIIANTMGEMCTAFTSSGDKSVGFAWLFAICYSLQIYFDFSGYSDMAIGLGKILGFDFMENFNYPFISKSVTEFWRRWHISLGSWFRDYVYIPLGGNRVGRMRHIVNIFTVWLLTGFWHGAEWNFVIWGLFFAVLLTVEKFFLLKYLKGVAGHIYVILVTLISFAIFSAESLEGAMGIVGEMFAFGRMPLVSEAFIYNVASYLPVIILAVVASTPLGSILYAGLKEKRGFGTAVDILEIPVLLTLLLLVTAYLASGSFNPFLYFRF
ncbi:MAG: MBOAT family protein [Clostridia bacterium]|nr:MBOAT family protein [Clostridia bacterium]